MQGSKCYTGFMSYSRFMSFLVIASLCFFTMACNEKPAIEDQAKDVAVKAENDAAKDANDDHAHDGHSGEEFELATEEFGDFKVKVVQIGEWSPKLDGVLECILVDPKKEPNAIRAWVGNQQADGVIKAKGARQSASDYDIHVELPDEFTEDALLWIELETDQSKKIRKSFPFKQK